MTVDVSVIITCYKKEAYLNECLESVFAQTKYAKEIILVHDGCDDPMSHKKVNTIILGENVGVAEARKIGFHNSTGKLILFLDADDAIPPDFIERSVVTLAKEADIAYPQMLLWYKDSQMKEQNQLYPTPKTLTPKILMKQCRIPVSSMMKRTVFEVLGGFPQIEVFEDYLFWLRAMARGFKFKFSGATLYYRQLTDSRNRQPFDFKRRLGRKITSNFVIKGNTLCERSTQS